MMQAFAAATVRDAEAPLLAAGEPLMLLAAAALAQEVAAVAEAASRVQGVAPIAFGAGAAAEVAAVAVAAGAAQQAAAVTNRLAPEVCLLVGAGNNGGDALFAGAQLASEGSEVTALLVGDRAHPEGVAALRAAGGRVVQVPDEWPVAAAALAAARSKVVVDGLLGIGARGPLTGVAGELVTALTDQLAQVGADRRPRVVAVDLPSGVSVDDGSVPGPVLPADVTVTFGAPKPALLLPPAAYLAGRIVEVPLGIPVAEHGKPVASRLASADAAAEWPIPGPRDHKYTRGVVGVVAGTDTYPGAAVLSCSAAVGAGAGLVRYSGPPLATQLVLTVRPEVVPGGGQVQAWVLGPGLPPGATGSANDQPGDASAAAQATRLRGALAAASGTLPGAGVAVPAVVDAGALSYLSGVPLATLPPWIVLTPHTGELAALFKTRGQQVPRAQIEAEPMRYARQAQELFGGTLLLKGSSTVILGPGTCFAQGPAPAWLATAGTGDVLAGLLGALLAARSAEVVAQPALAARLAAAAVLVHGRAAQAANPGGPVPALELAHALPTTIAQLLTAELGPS